MMEKKQIEFDYNTGKIERRFTEEWSNSGFININKLPDMVQSLVGNRNEMVKYIEALHDKIDDLIKKNNICSNPNCHTAYCTSDHK